MFRLAAPVLLALLLALAPAAQPAPAVDYVRLLDQRFFPERGDFLIGTPRDLVVIFPPAVADAYDINGGILLQTADGDPLMRQRISKFEQLYSDAFVEAPVTSIPERPSLADGAYTLDVALDGDIIGRVPFQITSTSSGDPFNPGTARHAEGPWRTHAFFEHDAGFPERRMTFNAWVAPDEVADTEAVEVSVRRNGTEVAFGHASNQPRYGWGEHMSFPLHTSASRDRRGNFATLDGGSTELWAIGDVTPGTYEIAFQTESGPFRTMTIEGADGAFVSHPRSAIDYEPRMFFLTPRRPGDGHNNIRNQMVLHWIAPAE